MEEGKCRNEVNKRQHEQLSGTLDTYENIYMIHLMPIGLILHTWW